MCVAVLALALAAWVTGCPSNAANANLPPSIQFYFPTGLQHLDSPVSPEGVLVVSNANFDKRFSSGSVMAINLGNVGLPKFADPVGAGGPIQLPMLNADDAGIVLISSFAGEMASLDLGQGRTRIFIPSRSEGMKLQAIDVDPLASATAQPVLHCATPDGINPSDCGTNAPSLSPKVFELSTTGVPRAPGPFGVNVRLRSCLTNDCPQGTCVAGQCITKNDAGLSEPLADVFVTHITQADSPLASNLLTRGYLVRLDSQSPTVTEDSFINLGAGATNSVVSGKRYVYLSGRGLNPTGNLLRLVDPQTIGTDGGVLLYSSGVEQSYRALETRGVALSTDEHRIYIAARVPDSLLIASINDPTATLPTIDVARTVVLPANPNEIRVIARPGHSDLLAISCTGAQSIAFYDDEVGNLVGTVNGVGLSPFDIAVDLREGGARLFVSDFDDGRVAVIDIPDLLRPQDARLVAHLGAQQLCLTQGERNPSLCDAGVTR
jgi:hypothetical protein